MSNGKIVGLGGVPLNKASGEEAERQRKLDVRVSCIGKFALPRRLIHGDLDGVLALMKDMVVVRAELIYISDAIEYIAISPKYFAEIGEAESPPIYDFQRRDDGVFVASRS